MKSGHWTSFCFLFEPNGARKLQWNAIKVHKMHWMLNAPFDSFVPLLFPFVIHQAIHPHHHKQSTLNSNSIRPIHIFPEVDRATLVSECPTGFGGACKISIVFHVWGEGRRDSTRPGRGKPFRCSLLFTLWLLANAFSLNKAKALKAFRDANDFHDMNFLDFTVSLTVTSVTYVTLFNFLTKSNNLFSGAALFWL